MSNPENVLAAAKQDDGVGDDEGVFSMYEELVALIALKKKRPPANNDEVVFFLLRELLPIVRDLSFYARVAREDIDNLLDAADDEAAILGTQFTHEDALKFDSVLQMAQGLAKEVITEQPDMAPERRAIFEKLIAGAEECLKIVEETTLAEEEPEDEPEVPAVPET